MVRDAVRAYSFTMKKTSHKIAAVRRLVSADYVRLSDGDGDTPGVARRFTMSAYTGDQVAGAFGPEIVDVSGMDMPAGPIPILLSHDRDQRVGYSESVDVDGGQINITGRMLTADHGVTQDADEGFPFQSSIGFRVLEVDRVEERRRWCTPPPRSTSCRNVSRARRSLCSRRLRHR